MINEKVENVLNSQINKEFYSAYLYLAMSAYFDKIGLFGFSKWTKIQAREEVDHGMIIFDYIIDRGGQVNLEQINVPEKSFDGPLQVFNKILEHEKHVTESVNSIVTMSNDECDFATRHFINWYISEQVEEEKSVSDIIDRLKLFGDDCTSLYLMDQDLSKRQYTQHTYK